MRIYGLFITEFNDCFKELKTVGSLFNGSLIDLSDVPSLPIIGDLIDMDVFINPEEDLIEDETVRDKWYDTHAYFMRVTDRRFSRDPSGTYIILELERA